jgi:hypothetical protein
VPTYFRKVIKREFLPKTNILKNIQKSGKRILSSPFFEWDMLKDIYPYFRDLHIFISYPISFLQYKFELCRGFFSFEQCSFCLHLTCCGREVLLPPKMARRAMFGYQPSGKNWPQGRTRIPTFSLLQDTKWKTKYFS